MKVISCRVEQIKGCELADVTLNEKGITVIGGDNHQGKSSFLDGLAMALGGKKLFPPEPIRNGEEEAEVTVKLSGGVDILPWPCTVTRTIKRSESGAITTKVLIESEDGDASPSPQTILNSLLGKGLGFDPLGFVRQSAKEQVETMKSLVGLDFDEVDAERQAMYDKRTALSREAKQWDGKVKQTPIHHDVPNEKVSIKDLMTQLEAAEIANAMEMKERETRSGYERALDGSIREVKELEDRIALVKKAIVELQNAMKDIDSKKTELIDTAPIKAKLMKAEEINRMVDDNEQRLEWLTQKKTLEAQANSLTKKIEQIDKDKRKAMAEADWPLDGLGFSRTGVTLNDTPYQQLASSEQLNVAVAIALSMNKEFPFAIIRDGSLLDKATLEQLANVVEAHDGQVLIERVSKGAECSVIFESGRRVG